MRGKVGIALKLAGVLIFLAVAHSGWAQAPEESARPRILTAINDRQRIALPGNTHRLARPEFDRGAAPPDLQLDHMLLVLTRTPEQQAALDRLLAEQQDKKSPNYHHWLTPEQFGASFGVSPDDIAQLTAWLESHGFTVDEVPASRGAIEFSGTAGQLQEAFHTAIHRYLVRGEEHWANASDPEIPQALGEVVRGVANLNSFFAKPNVVRSSAAFPIPSAAGAQPLYSLGWYYSALAPQDYAVIYNLNPLYQAGVNGSGATIAVVGRSNINVQDVNDFRRVFGLPVNPPQIIVNGTNPGDLGGGEETEAVLDNSWAGAVAKNATVKFVVSASTNTADGTLLSEQYVINHNLADVMTESFGLCEGDVPQSYGTYLSGLAQQAAAEGISYMVSAGDAGSSGCDNDDTETTATGPLSVNVLGSSPYTTTVGGTQFNEDVGAGPYWSESNLSAYYLSVLSYIPENVWNQSCAASKCTNPNIVAGGGGASQYFTKPAWQAGVAGIPNDNARDVPDVSLTASAAHDPYLLCIDGDCASGVSTPGFIGVGGTSASAPSFAGIMALVRQRTGSRQGAANAVLYRLAAAQQLSGCNASSGTLPGSTCIFNDVTVGNNSVPGGHGYGTSNAPYTAGTGYDLATGLGSVNATNLVTQWNSANGTSTPGVLLSPLSIAFGNQALNTTSSARTVTLTNTGNATLTISSIAMVGANPRQFADTTTCGGSLNAGASCTMAVTLTPTFAGAMSTALTVTDNAPGSPQSVALSGTGVATPAASLSTTSFSFGTQVAGTVSSVRTVTLTDTGTGTLTISGIAISGATPNAFSQSNTCGSALNAGASCVISVEFSANGAGSRSASVVVTDNAVNSPQSITLTGTALGPLASLSPASIAFGNQTVSTTSTARTVTLTNTGNAAMSISSIAMAGGNPRQFADTTTCGSTLNAGASCTIAVTLAPTFAGAMSTALTVTDNAPYSPQSVAVSGTGVATPAASLSTTSFSFGTQVAGTVSSVRTVTLTDTGTGTLAISGIAISGATPNAFSQSNTCGSALNAGASCVISVKFSANGAGSRSASVVVTDNAANSPQSITLTGTALGPLALLGPASIAFGNQTVSTTSTARTATLTNTGNAAMSISGIAMAGGNPRQFADTTTCGSSLNAGASCTIAVTLAPTFAGAMSTALTVTDNAPYSPQSVTLSGTGVATPAASLTATSFTFGAQVAGTVSSVRTVTLTDTGTGALAISGIAVSGATPGAFSQSNTCGSTLNAGASCVISVEFSANGAGSRSASVVVTDNAANSPQSITLTGTALGPLALLSPASIAFGNQTVSTTSTARTVTLTNTGNAAMSISSIAMAGGNPRQFADTTTCGSSLNAGASCTIAVTLAPTFAGAMSTALTVTDNAPYSPQSVALSGTGVAALAASPSTASLAFGSRVAAH